ncbi:MAG: hypothetical protein M3Y27_27295, partial [Acidobacteriota bacterium]|nr:hypothetical protein [Acidobacteriota bacterium]
IDVNGNIWVSGYGNNNVVKLSSSGVILSGSSGYTASGMDFLRGLAVDSSGVIWVGNYGGNNPASVFMLSNNGTSSQSFTATNMNSPDAPMVDAGGNIWFANEISDTLTKFSSKGTVLSDSGYSISKPGILRMDATGGVWTMNIFNQNMEHISGTGASLSGVSGYVTCVPQSMGDLSTSCPGFAGARGFGIDGAGSLWARSITFLPTSSPTPTSAVTDSPTWTAAAISSAALPASAPITVSPPPLWKWMRPAICGASNPPKASLFSS